MEHMRAPCSISSACCPSLLSTRNRQFVVLGAFNGELSLRRNRKSLNRCACLLELPLAVSAFIKNYKSYTGQTSYYFGEPLRKNYSKGIYFTVGGVCERFLVKPWFNVYLTVLDCQILNII